MPTRLADLPLPAPLHKLVERAASRLQPFAVHALSLLPPSVKRPVLEQLLNRALEPSRFAGEFDFLDGRTVAIHVADADWSMTITGDGGGRLRVITASGAETRISATSGDFLALAAGHIDPDTLFFQRRLRIEGNVALGLEVKNTLDGIDRATFPPPLRAALRFARSWFARRDGLIRGAAQAAPRLTSPGRPYQ